LISVFILLSTITALLVLVIFTHRLWRNLRFLAWIRNQKPVTDRVPLVSILVPARNESANITACVESLLQQSYANFQVIVLNDHSTDDTGSQLDQLALQYPNLSIIHSDIAPPSGWNGKSYACHRLAQKASGDWLLFTDADTIHSADSITLGMTQAAVLKVDFLSALPRQETKTWSERLMVSFIMDFLPLVGWDFQRIAQGKTKQIAANGQYLLVRAKTYQAVGGHAAIHEALVDDFALAYHCYRSGHRIALVDGAAMLTCRMYRTGREVWDGFSKNIVLSLSETATSPTPLWQLLLFGWAYASVFVTPYILLFLPHGSFAILSILWLWLLEALVFIMRRRSIWQVPWVSLSALGVMLLSLNAIYRQGRGKSITWKDRLYH
jgi:chlorobactene glucosyltransferase